MAIRAGRVGVRPDQVDPYGRLKATDWLVDKLREILNTNSAEIHASQLARLELERLELDKDTIQKPFEPIIEPVIEPVVNSVEKPVETTVKKTTRKKVTK